MSGASGLDIFDCWIGATRDWFEAADCIDLDVCGGSGCVDGAKSANGLTYAESGTGADCGGSEVNGLDWIGWLLYGFIFEFVALLLFDIP